MNEVFEKFTHLLAPQPDSYTKKKNYRMGRTLGHGSFGIVRLAKQKVPTEEVAIKVILKSAVKDNEQLVYRELEANKRLNHKGIVPYKEWFESKDKFYLVFGLCRGGELFERLIQRGKFTERNAQALILQVLEAVDYLHDQGVVHRDIKPENLLFENESDDSPLRLTDFGISSFTQDDDDMLTTVCGSRGYVAPEILLRKGYGKPVDMWAIGIMTYLLLCGSNPFRSIDDTRELLEAMQNERYRFNPRYWNSISPEAKEFIKALLKGKPEQRLTAKEALQHTWFTGKSATDHDILQHVREGFDARAVYRRAFDKLRALNYLTNKRSSYDSTPEECSSGDPESPIDVSVLNSEEQVTPINITS